CHLCFPSAVDIEARGDLGFCAFALYPRLARFGLLTLWLQDQAVKLRGALSQCQLALFAILRSMPHLLHQFLRPSCLKDGNMPNPLAMNTLIDEAIQLFRENETSFGD